LRLRGETTLGADVTVGTRQIPGGRGGEFRHVFLIFRLLYLKQSRMGQERQEENIRERECERGREEGDANGGV
jgi:hypothetical protein